MRFSRLLLLIAAAAAVAVVAVPSAGALTFPDDLCPVGSGTVIKVCPSGSTGKPYSLQLKGRDGTGCVPFVEFKIDGTLPTGLTATSSGLISGTPTQAGEWTFWVIMRDIPASQGGVSWCADDNATEKQFSIKIFEGLQIQQRQNTLTPGQLNTAYSLQFTASGGGAPTWSMSGGALPAGLTLSSTGLLSGTPTTEGTYSFKVTVADSNRSDTETYTMSVVPKLEIASLHGVAEVGVPLHVTPQATGGKASYTWSVDASTPLPAGLTLDTATGTISGTPSTAGQSSLKLVVTDSLGLSTSVDVPFTVVAHLALVKKTLPTAKAGSRYSAPLAKTGGARPFRWSATGLPRGLGLSASTGRLTGAAAQAGTYRLRVRLKDALGAVSTRTYVLKVVG